MVGMLPILLVTLSYPPPLAIAPGIQRSEKPETSARRKGHEYLYGQAQKRKKQKNQSNTDNDSNKGRSLGKEDSLKWEKLGGSQKICMGAHQYDQPALKRIAQLGTCPAARGSFIPTARIASHVI